MHSNYDSITIAPEGPVEEVAAIFADGLRRLRDRGAIHVKPISDNLQQFGDGDLEAVRTSPLTDHVG